MAHPNSRHPGFRFLLISRSIHSFFKSPRVSRDHTWNSASTQKEDLLMSFLFRMSSASNIFCGPPVTPVLQMLRPPTASVPLFPSASTITPMPSSLPTLGVIFSISSQRRQKSTNGNFLRHYLCGPLLLTMMEKLEADSPSPALSHWIYGTENVQTPSNRPRQLRG